MKSNHISRYFDQVWWILTRPTSYFRQLPLTGGVTVPISFALITHWLGSSFGFLWSLALGKLIGSQLSAFFNDAVDFAGHLAEVDHPGRHAQFVETAERVRDWFLGAGSILLDPALTFVKILVVSFFVFLGARIFVTPGKDQAPSEITFESALRVVCYGLTPSILAAFPLIGGFFSSLLVFYITLIAAKECYRISSARAMWVAFFPQVLIFAVLLMLFLAVGLFFIKAMVSFF